MKKLIKENQLMPDLSQEWRILQAQSDLYETHSLWIKLICLMIFSSALLLDKISFIFIIIIAIFWLQDAIWKTFQSRIEPRLLQIEAAFNTSQETIKISAYQFNSEYLAHRSSGLSLIKEYLIQALRPTIAYPYLLLIIMGFFMI